MALTINTNMASMLVQRNLDASTVSLNTAIQRMTTGYRINSAKDDAAGMAVAIKLDTQLGAYDVALQNAQMGSAMLTTMEENNNLVLGHLQRIRDLAEQASNGVYDDDSKKAISSEIQARLYEIDRLADSVEFNGKNLLDGTSTTSVNIQVGINGGTYDRITIDSTALGDTHVEALLKKTGTGAYDFTTGDKVKANPTGALAAIDTAIGTIKTRITSIGSFQNRIESAAESIEVARSNVSSALSTVRDADVSTESSNYIKAQILQQAAASLLTTANQTPSIALNLI